MINWPAELGGRGLPSTYLRAYNTEEAKFVTPSAGELPPTSMGLIATTVAAYGTPEQKQQWIEPLMRMDELGCQLFSETVGRLRPRRRSPPAPPSTATSGC